MAGKKDEVTAALASFREGRPEVADDLVAVEQLHERKLWHQLTVKLLDLLSQPCFDKGSDLVGFYNNFVASFSDHMNKLSLVRLAELICRQVDAAETATTFLEAVREKVKEDTEASVYADMLLATIQLHRAGDLEATKKLLEGAEERLAALPHVDSAIHAAYFRVSADYCKKRGIFSDFYREALKFLGVAELSSLPLAEQQARAFDIGVAGLLGEGIYNFGELLGHPVVKSLQGTEHAWLAELLVAFNTGDIAAFERLQPKVVEQQDLSGSSELLREKIRLLAVMELVFHRPADSRNLHFSDIADAAKVPLAQVELLVMRALSLKLIRGSLNEVEQRVSVEWVQPRVLTIDQIGFMERRVSEWCKQVDSTVLEVEKSTPDLFV